MDDLLTYTRTGSAAMEKSYWGSNGKHQDLHDKLRPLIPNSGSVENPNVNKALEKFRKASNCYYDLYNNGLCNRAREFAGIFKIASSRYPHPVLRYSFSDRLYELVEEKMDEIILEAAKEQNII